MPSYKVYVTVYHTIDDVEADSPEQAKEIVTTDVIWDDHVKDVAVDVEELTDA